MVGPLKAPDTPQRSSYARKVPQASAQLGITAPEHVKASVVRTFEGSSGPDGIAASQAAGANAVTFEIGVAEMLRRLRDSCYVFSDGKIS
jgi:hypothetical protein